MAKSKNLGGRPEELLKSEKVNQLKTAFSDGLTIDQACVYAKISKQTYYNHIEKYPEFLDEINALRQNISILAKRNVVNRIKEGDEISSKWWLERKDKDEFSLKTETQLSGEVTEKVVYIDKEEKEAYNNHIDKIINED